MSITSRLIDLTPSTGLNLLARFVSRTTGQIWNNTTNEMEDWTSSDNWTNYGVTTSETYSGSCQYLVNYPTGLPRDLYNIKLNKVVENLYPDV